MELELIKEIATGGNASTVLVKYGRRGVPHLARITWTFNFETDTRMHRVLFHEMPNWIPAIKESVDYGTAMPPPHVRKLLELTDEGTAMLREMEHDPERTVTLTIMEYADGGDFEAVPSTDIDRIRLVISEVLLFLYCAQVRLGFQHGDLHAKNIVLAGDQPKVIDFDFSSFYTQRQHGQDHGLATAFILPPELQGEHRYPRDSFLGAPDIWALGLMLVSKVVGVHSILRELVYAQGWNGSQPHHWTKVIYWLQTELGIIPHDPGLDTPSKNVRKLLSNVRYRLVEQQPEAHQVCQRMLHSDQRERTFAGALFLYFDMPYFQQRSGMTKRVREMARLRLKVGAKDPLPLTTQYNLQVQTLLESAIQFQCSNCKTNKVDLHVCRNTGYVVCGLKCWNAIHGTVTAIK